MKIYQMSKFFFLIFFSSGLYVQSFGQNFYKERIPKTNIVGIGIGPSSIFADNAGQYRKLNFKINPSFSLSYSKKISPHVELRSTGGYQYVESGGEYSQGAQLKWLRNMSAYSFEGRVLFLDVMPVFYLFPFESHINRHFINYYGGVGFGALQIKTDQAFSFNQDAARFKNTETAAYVPIRIGVSYRLNHVSDICVEGVTMLTFSDNLDGNMNYNQFNDHLFQAQVIYRRFLKLN